MDLFVSKVSSAVIKSCYFGTALKLRTQPCVLLLLRVIVPLLISDFHSKRREINNASIQCNNPGDLNCLLSHSYSLKTFNVLLHNFPYASTSTFMALNTYRSDNVFNFTNICSDFFHRHYKTS